MNRFIFIVALVLTTALAANGQHGLDFALSPNITFHSLGHGKDLHSNSAFDSIKDLHKVGYSMGVEFAYVYSLNSDLHLQAGIRYNTVGFNKQLNDLQFQDSIHPDIGRINDLSDVSSKDATLRYRISYLEIPLRINYRISPNSQLFKYGVYLSGGLIVQYRITDYTNIDLQGFTVHGQSKFKKKSSHIRYNNFNGGPAIGVRAFYRLSKNLWVLAKPEIYFPVGDVANDQIRYRFYQFSGNIGLNYTFE